jgi:hypothetical protein
MTSDTTTLYLRRIPTRLVREAKAVAARRGSTLAKLVADTLDRSLGDRTETPSAEGDDLGASMAWYAANRARLARRYGGKYVAIVAGAVIGCDQDFEALAERVFKRVGLRPVFMPRVEARERPLRLRSPRLARS